MYMSKYLAEVSGWRLKVFSESIVSGLSLMV